jgi:hypothetical protein
MEAKSPAETTIPADKLCPFKMENVSNIGDDSDMDAVSEQVGFYLLFHLIILIISSNAGKLLVL